MIGLIDTLAARFPALACDGGAARHYARIKTVATRDEHFRAIEGVTAAAW